MFLVMHNWTVHTYGSGEPYGNQISRKKTIPISLGHSQKIYKKDIFEF